MEVDHLIMAFIVVFGAILGIYVKQERINASQEKTNENIEKRVTHVEEESDGHRDKINNLLVTMNEKIGKIYTIVEGLKK